MKFTGTNIDDTYYQIIKPLIETPEVQSLKKYIHHYFESRFDHSLAVSYYSYRLGLKLGMDTYAIARAGLLHDLFFYDTHNMTMTTHQHLILHPEIAYENASKITTLSSLERDIILHHMWPEAPDRPQSREAYLVNFVDTYLAVSEFTRGRYFDWISNNKPQKLITMIKVIEVSRLRKTE